MTCSICQITVRLNKVSTEGGNFLFHIFMLLFSAYGEGEGSNGHSNGRSGIYALLLHRCPWLLSAAQTQLQSFARGSVWLDWLPYFSLLNTSCWVASSWLTACQSLKIRYDKEESVQVECFGPDVTWWSLLLLKVSSELPLYKWEWPICAVTAALFLIFGEKTTLEPCPSDCQWGFHGVTVAVCRQVDSSKCTTPSQGCAQDVCCDVGSHSGVRPWLGSLGTPAQCWYPVKMLFGDFKWDVLLWMGFFQAFSHVKESWRISNDRFLHS